MVEEKSDGGSPAAFSADTAFPSHAGSAAGPIGEPAPHDVAALVAQMIEASQSPEPELLEQIAAAGHEAVEPLLAILRSKPRDWPEEAPLSHAIGLLQVIRDPAAIPDLIEIIRTYPDDAGQEAADALASYGEGIFDTLLELAADPALRGNRRSHAMTAARQAAGANPTMRARFADSIRQMLHDTIEQATRLRSGEPTTYQPPEDDFDLDIFGEISFLVSELACVADPLAHDLIKTAFDKDLVDTSTVNEEFVEGVYAKGGVTVWTPPDWLADYRDSHRAHLEFFNRVTQPPPAKTLPPMRVVAPASPPPAASAQGGTRKKATIVGRNDPCWCGSGKKYKKCHLGKEAPAIGRFD